MMYQLTSRDVTYQGYPIQYPLTGSWRAEETETSEILDSLFSIWMGQKRLKVPFFYRNLSTLFEIDISSVYPHFEIKSETSLIGEAIEEVIPEEMLEFDVVVRMSPIKEYTARVRIKSIEKAIPHIVEPKGI